MLQTAWVAAAHICYAVVHGQVQSCDVFPKIPRTQFEVYSTVQFRAELSQLEDKAQPRPYHQIRKVLISELGLAAESLFSDFEETATAAASIAQVSPRGKRTRRWRASCT